MLAILFDPFEVKFKRRSITLPVGRGGKGGAPKYVNKLTSPNSSSAQSNTACERSRTGWEAFLSKGIAKGGCKKLQ